MMLVSLEELGQQGRSRSMAHPADAASAGRSGAQAQHPAGSGAPPGTTLHRSHYLFFNGFPHSPPRNSWCSPASPQTSCSTHVRPRCSWTGAGRKSKPKARLAAVLLRQPP
jgi:hypothetical protein